MTVTTPHPDRDLRIRIAAFACLTRQVDIHGDVLPRRPLLEGGFRFEDQTIQLITQQGIFTPQLDLPLPNTTTPADRTPTRY